MKKLMLIIVFSIINGVVFANTLHDDPCKYIKMPSQEVLAKRLNKAGFNHYDEKTKLSKKLGGAIKPPFGVAMLVLQANYDYKESFEEGTSSKKAMLTLIDMRTPDLIRVLLEDHSEAIVCLENNDII